MIESASTLSGSSSTVSTAAGDHVADVVGRLGRGDHDVEPAVALPQLGQRIGDQRQITGEDPVAGERARHLDHEVVIAVGDRLDLGEGGEPDRFGELRPQQLRDRGPHLLLITHPDATDQASITAANSAPCHHARFACSTHVLHAPDQPSILPTVAGVPLVVVSAGRTPETLSARTSTRLSTGVDKPIAAWQAQDRSTIHRPCQNVRCDLRLEPSRASCRVRLPGR